MKTTCPYCGVGCGVEVVTDISADNATGFLIRGDNDHPANQGKLCSKGSALADTLTPHGRLTHPVLYGERCTWNDALDTIADKMASTIADYGRESIAFYVSGQVLTEDYYVVNKFTKGWLGTANIDTNSRLCMASSVVGHKRAFGSDTVPGCYDDLTGADLVILTGSNLAWCHPVIFQRIMAEKQKRPEMTLVVIDPRRTVTADAADLHLALKPDTDVELFSGLLRYLVDKGAVDQDYIGQHVNGFDEAVEACAGHDIATIAESTGLDLPMLLEFYDRFLGTGKTVTLYSQGVNQSVNGTDKVNAIINCHLATGRIGKPGTGPFSITGQPNAMGGREVGGLATMLASHMELGNVDHQKIVQQFWHSPYIANKPGYCAVDLFQAVADGTIKMLWIMGTNPADSMPMANRVKEALQACPFVIVSDVAEHTDTLQLAHAQLPAQAWGEKNGTVTNSERCISRQRSVKKIVGEARPDWWAVAQVAQRLGYGDAFAYDSPADIFREHAMLSGMHNEGTRDFDISACASLTATQYDALSPFYWPWAAGQSAAEPIRFFAKGRFFTPDGKARMVTIDSGNRRVPHSSKAIRSNAGADKYPLTLNTGRIRDQWHTMTRTGLSVRLSQHIAEPFVVLHPDDASNLAINDADIAHVVSPHGDVLLRTLISDRQKPGEVFSPMHWSEQYASQSRINTLLSAAVDPHSKQPASKQQPVCIKRFEANSYAYAVMRHKPALKRHIDSAYWALAPIEGGWQFEFASTLSAAKLRELLLQIALEKTDTASANVVVMESSDKQNSNRRIGLHRNERIQALIFLSESPVLASRSWARQQLSAAVQPPAKRWQLLAGQPAADQPDKGAIVCSCFSVGASQIERALSQGLCEDVAGVGEQLQAGTNCGSCRSEIQTIVRRVSICKTDTQARKVLDTATVHP